MRPMNMKNATSKTQLFLALVVAVTLSLARPAFAAAPGITGTSTAGQNGRDIQPDGPGRLPESAGRIGSLLVGIRLRQRLGAGRSSPRLPLPSRQAATPCRFPAPPWSSQKGRRSRSI